MPAKDKLNADFKKFNLNVEDACQREIEEIRQHLDALKAKAKTIA